MSNIVSLKRPPKKTVEIPVVNPSEEALKFVHDYLIDWAVEQGVNIDSQEFKYECATITTVLQGMLWKTK